MRRLRDRSLRAASFNVVLGEVMAQRVKALGIPQGRIRVISNWADGSFIRPVAAAANPLRREWGLTGKFVVGYSGNLGRAHDVETILRAITITENASLNLARPIAWLFIGGGTQSVKLRRDVAALGLTSVAFKAYQPHENLAISLSAADVHLVTLRPELEGLIVPSKYYGIAAAGRATIFIGSPDGQIARGLADSGGGLTVDQGNGDALAKAVLELASEPARAAAMGQHAKDEFEREYDLPIAIGRWRALLAELDANPAPSERTPHPASY